MVDTEPFDHVPSLQPEAGQASPGSVILANGQAWNESWPGELPPPYMSLEDSFALHYQIAVSSSWPPPYIENSDSIEHAAWDRNQIASVDQAYPSYINEPQFSPQDFQCDLGPSLPSTYYQPSDTVNQSELQHSPVSYSQPEAMSEPIHSTPSSPIGNSIGPGSSFESQPNHPPEQPKTRRKSTKKNKAQKSPGNVSGSPLDLENDYDPPRASEHTKERNRVAANKFRNRKRKVYAQLKLDEEAMEQRHNQLSVSAKHLMQEVYQLKMQLLKHADCDCALIQNYIKNEAHRYIHGK